MAEPERVGVVVMAYGTPSGPDQLEAYYTHVRRGRPPTAEQVADLRRRYDAIGGSSPLLAVTRAEADGLQAALDLVDPGRFRVAMGMKHAPPFVEDAVAELAGEGIRRTVGLVLAPHYSALSVGEYAERAQAAAGEAMELTMVECWHGTPAYLDFLATEVERALSALHPTVEDRAEVVFTAHSLPARVEASGDPYPAQLHETAAAVAERGHLDRWSVAWQSAGRTPEPWLGPALLDVLPGLRAGGRWGVVVCPAGFVSDHLEVLYDLDVEARAAAAAAGLRFARTATPNAAPWFATMLAEVVRDHLADAR